MARSGSLAVPHEQPGEDAPRVRRQLEKTFRPDRRALRERRAVSSYACGQRYCHLRARGVSTSNSEALCLNNARWTMLRWRVELNGTENKLPDDSWMIRRWASANGCASGHQWRRAGPSQCWKTRAPGTRRPRPYGCTTLHKRRLACRYTAAHWQKRLAEMEKVIGPTGGASATSVYNITRG